MYKTVALQGEYFKFFKGIYNDFLQNAKDDYKFEIDPLSYQDFIDCFEKKLLDCILLLEDDIPTGFLTYSTKPDEVIEMYIMHFLGNEDLQKKVHLVLNAFMQTIALARTRKIIEFPMIGVQKQFKNEFEQAGFRFVELGIMAIDFKSDDNLKEILANQIVKLPIGYKIVPYSAQYYTDLPNMINSTFSSSCDAKFDPRFLTFEGSMDVANKITNSFYGQFLSAASKILLFENKPVGFCLANTTTNKIANIPLIGILKEQRGLSLSPMLLKSTVDEIIKLHQNGTLHLDELNASVDMLSKNAVCMYKKVGFKEIYTYPQAYLPKSYPNIY